MVSLVSGDTAGYVTDRPAKIFYYLLVCMIIMAIMVNWPVGITYSLN